MMPLSNPKGFTLLEVLAAIMVFALGVLALYRLQAATVTSNAFSYEVTQASILAQGRMEELMGVTYDNLNDVDGDGEGGLDDTGQPDPGNPAGAADSCMTVTVKADPTTHVLGYVVANDCTAALRPVVDYRIANNIALNDLLGNVTTIQVIATWVDSKRVTHRVVFRDGKSPDKPPS
jgi:prepilin-type N-terminal cleavage/methylation domain-containing protein